MLAQEQEYAQKMMFDMTVEVKKLFSEELRQLKAGEAQEDSDNLTEMGKKDGHKFGKGQNQNKEEIAIKKASFEYRKLRAIYGTRGTNKILKNDFSYDDEGVKTNDEYEKESRENIADKQSELQDNEDDAEGEDQEMP